MPQQNTRTAFGLRLFRQCCSSSPRRTVSLRFPRLCSFSSWTSLLFSFLCYRNARMSTDFTMPSPVMTRMPTCCWKTVAGPTRIIITDWLPNVRSRLSCCNRESLPTTAICLPASNTVLTERISTFSGIPIRVSCKHEAPTQSLPLIRFRTGILLSVTLQKRKLRNWRRGTMPQLSAR